MIDSINITLANTKEMLIKQEASNKILLENNRMLKKQIEALEQQKELLEKILDSQNNISDKVSNIKNTSNRGGSTDSGCDPPRPGAAGAGRKCRLRRPAPCCRCSPPPWAKSRRNS